MTESSDEDEHERLNRQFDQRGELREAGAIAVFTSMVELRERIGETALG